MSKVKVLWLSVMLVVVLSVSACTVPLPAAVGTVERTLTAQLAANEPASTAVRAVENDLQSTLQKIYQDVNPSVVNIQVTGVADPTVTNSPSGPQSRQGQALGSGFVWDRQGNIVTNNHVVDGATKITVFFADGASAAATVVGRDPESDLAVIKVDPKGLDLRPVQVGDSTQVKVGQFVVAIGNPFGLSGSMSFGIVSALGRSLPASSSNGRSSGSATYTIPDIIQTDAPVNPGNSGGVLVDLSGQVIGVPSAMESSTNSSSGVGFAVPGAIVKQVAPALIKDGKYIHPWIGITGTNLTPEMAQAMSLDANQRGALVVAVASGSPAEKSGLRGSEKQVTIDGNDVQVGGDVIVGVDGQAVKRFDDLTSYLARFGQVGQTIKLTVLRDGKETTVSLTLGARPSANVAAQAITPSSPSNPSSPTNPRSNPRTNPSNPSNPTTPRSTPSSVWLGINGVTLTSEIAQAMNLKSDQQGVLVVAVADNSPASEGGLQGGDQSTTINGQRLPIGGDVIVAINGKPVATMETLAATIQAGKAGDRVTLDILRDGESLQLKVTLATRPS